MINNPPQNVYSNFPYDYQYSFYNTLEVYKEWYHSLDPELQQKEYTPEQYSWYLYQQYCEQYQQAQPSNIKKCDQKKTTKLSRNQKRKLKKKKLQEQLQAQKESIGSWVKLERKDLIESLEKIKDQEEKKKQKKKNKLSHLKQIHKEVYKEILKRQNQGKPTTLNYKHNKKPTIGHRKKKISHIKKMKQLYAQFKENGQGEYNGRIYKCKKQSEQYESPHGLQSQETIIEKKEEDDEKDQNYITESESESEDKELKQQDKKKGEQKEEEPNEQSQIKQEKEVRYIKPIQYEYTGKLTNSVYNSICIRQWVDHLQSSSLEDKILVLINKLALKQAINKVKKPTKYKKLIVGGVHQSRRTLKSTLPNKKSKILIIALNIERNELSQGIDDQIQQLIQYAKKQGLMVVHTSTRQKLGRAFTGKWGPKFTVLSIINYEGYDQMFTQIVQEYKQLRGQYDLIDS